MVSYFIVDCVFHSNVEIMIVFDAQVDDFMDRKQALGQTKNILSSFNFTENMTVGMVSDSSDPKFIFTMCWSHNKTKDKLISAAFTVDKDKTDNIMGRCTDYLTLSNKIGFQTVRVDQMMLEK